MDLVQCSSSICICTVFDGVLFRMVGGKFLFMNSGNRE